MINIVGKPRLQAALRIIAQGASTVDESLVNTRNFDDVSVRRDGIPVRQNKPEYCFWAFV
jgi:hypothetical protein